MAMAAAVPTELDHSITRGDTYVCTITWPDEYVLDDAEWAAQIRAAHNDSDVLAEFDIDIDGSTLTLTLPADVTADLTRSVWDLQRTFIADDTVQTVFIGTVYVTRDVTREVAP